MSSHELIRRSRPEDLPRLSALFQEAFGQQRPVAVWHWKYFGVRAGVGYVCEVADRLVAHCGGIPVRFRDGTREYPAHQSVDFMSSPAYPGGLGGGGVFVRTVRRMFEEQCGPGGAQLVYGFPGERHRLVGEKLLGYRPLERVMELTLQPSSDSVRPAPLSRKLLDLFAQSPSLGAIRDRSYLAWRYLEHPLHRYQVVTSKRRWWQAPAAVLLRQEEDRFLIMEATLESDSFAELVALLSRLGKPVQAWLSERHEQAFRLLHHGFVAAPRDHSVEYRFFFDRAPLSPGQLYYTLGDYDVY